MKLAIHDLENKKAGEKQLPIQFGEAYRPDLIKRAVHALQSAARQSYGASPDAGQRHSTKVSKRRRDYRGSYGFGISRVARKILSRRGTRMFWMGAFSPQTVGGRRAHPPKALKDRTQKINVKENKKAIRSAIASTVDKKVVESRGHQIPQLYPFLVSASFENLTKTKDVEKALLSFGFDKELERGEYKKVRPGVGKHRGRPYQRKKSVLIVVSEDCPLVKSGKNVPGVEVVVVNSLNAELLAPGAHAGRVTLWTEKAIDVLDKNKLYL
jgi:large subunit ribosomal protein L4e